MFVREGLEPAQDWVAASPRDSRTSAPSRSRSTRKTAQSQRRPSHCTMPRTTTARTRLGRPTTLTVAMSANASQTCRAGRLLCV